MPTAIFTQWMMMLVVTTGLLVAYFFYLCYTTRVLACFGRKALDSSSMSYLFLLGCVPACYMFTLLASPEIFRITDSNMATFLLAICLLSAKILMQWLAQGIRIPFQIEVDPS